MVDLTCNGMSSISTKGVVWKILFPLLEASSTTTTTVFRQQFCKNYLHRNHLCAHSIFIMIHPTRIKLLSAREILTCQLYTSSSKVCSLHAIAKVDFFGMRSWNFMNTNCWIFQPSAAFDRRVCCSSGKPFFCQQESTKARKALQLFCSSISQKHYL